MKLTSEPLPALAICLNTAWQKTLIFEHFEYGKVNRARLVKECGGGKGVNVARVFRQLGMPIKLAGFAGGIPGNNLKNELITSGATPLLVNTKGNTRCCFTVISEDNGIFTEMIEPSASISIDEKNAMLDLIIANINSCGSVIFSGTVPPGIEPDFSASVAKAAAKAKVPFILDAVKNIEPTLKEGVAILKINADELKLITGIHEIRTAGKHLLASYPKLQWLAVTDGPDPAFIFSRNQLWSISIPKLEHIVSAIGGGDCATAIVARRMAEGTDDMPMAFAEALACASASCLTDTPSLFSRETADMILKNTSITQLQF